MSAGTDDWSPTGLQRPRSYASGAGWRHHIFVVDRSPAFLAAVRESFQGEGYDVTAIHFSPRTFDQIATSQPSLVIVGLAIGQQEGWSLLAELKQETATYAIPVIIVSASPHFLEAARANRALWGGDRYLLNPFAFDELRRAVAELLDTRQWPNLAPDLNQDVLPFD